MSQGIVHTTADQNRHENYALIVSGLTVRGTIYCIYYMDVISYREILIHHNWEGQFHGGLPGLVDDRGFTVQLL